MAFLWGERRAGRYRIACSAKIIKLKNATKNRVFRKSHRRISASFSDLTPGR
jgi:hypothetical protein